MVSEADMWCGQVKSLAQFKNGTQKEVQNSKKKKNEYPPL